MWIFLRTIAGLWSNIRKFRGTNKYMFNQYDVDFVLDFCERIFQRILADNFRPFFFLIKIVKHSCHICLSWNSFENRWWIGRLWRRSKLRIWENNERVGELMLKQATIGSFLPILLASISRIVQFWASLLLNQFLSNLVLLSLVCGLIQFPSLWWYLLSSQICMLRALWLLPCPRDQQIKAIEESFKAAKLRPKHLTKPELEAVEILPLLPDFDRYYYVPSPHCGLCPWVPYDFSNRVLWSWTGELSSLLPWKYTL